MRLALFRLCADDSAATGRHPLRSPVNARDVGPAVAFCGLLPEAGLFLVPLPDTAEAAAEAAAEAHDAPPATAPGDGAADDGVPLVAATSRAPRMQVSPQSVCGGEVRVTKVAMDLERSGKVTLSCACVGSHATTAAGEVTEVSGFVSELNFLAPLS